MQKHLVIFSLLMLSVLNTKTAENPILSSTKSTNGVTIKKRGRLVPMLFGFITGSATTAWALEKKRDVLLKYKQESLEKTNLLLTTLQKSWLGARQPWQELYNSDQLPQQQSSNVQTLEDTEEKNEE